MNQYHLGASLQECGESNVSVQCCRQGNAIRPIHAVLQVCFFIVGLVLLESDELQAFEAWANWAYWACIALSFPLFRKAVIVFRTRRVSVEFLMATAMLGSVLSRELREAAMIGALVTSMDMVIWISIKAVESRLSSIIPLQPNTVVLQDGQTIPVSNLKQGMVFIVRAGDGVVADGTVLKGMGTVDESSLTGEPLPVTKQKGSTVFGGCVLQNGFLEVTANAEAEFSFHGKLLSTVQEVKSMKSNADLVVNKFAAWYTPTVFAIALIVALVQNDFAQFLVIVVAGCPCSLLSASPFVQATTLFVLASRHNLLVKETSALESLARLRWLGMDKTGTLTTGCFKVFAVLPVGEFTREQLLQWAAAVESRDTHPLARSIVQSYTGCVDVFRAWDCLPAVTGFRREGRSGVRGIIEGRMIGVGNYDFIKSCDMDLESEASRIYAKWSSQVTVLFVAVDERVAGVLLLDDSLRTDSVNTVAKLKALGIQSVLLTGDCRVAADRAAKKAGIEEVHAALLPEDKASIVFQATWGQSTSENLDIEQRCPLNRKCGPVEVGFIGDGLNDCAALAIAHVGIAMHGIGMQATKNAANAVLQDGIGQVYAAIIVARRSQRLIIANIALAVLINVGMIAAAIFVGLPLWLSVLVDNGSLLAVLANSLWPLCWRVQPVPVANEASCTDAPSFSSFQLQDGQGVDSP